MLSCQFASARELWQKVQFTPSELDMYIISECEQFLRERGQAEIHRHLKTASGGAPASV